MFFLLFFSSFGFFALLVLKRNYSLLVSAVFLFCSIVVLKTFGSLTTFQSFYALVFVFDEYSFWLTLITCIIVYLSFIVGVLDLKFSASFSKSLRYFLLFVSRFFVFSLSNIFLLYLFYEISLLPIIYIIVKWGSYPDRFVSSIIMLAYTTVFSFPLMALIIFINDFSYGLTLLNIGLLVPLWSGLVILFSFAVKLPVYGLHYWLPMAHVEAPTGGSMILAGILLKLGGCALYRFSAFVSFIVFNKIFLVYLMFAIVLVSVIASFQSDFKRLVAYSSVVHITILLLSLFSGVEISIKAFLIIIVFHGFVSPFMFIMVGSLYKLSNTRLLSMISGSVYISYSTAFMLILMFLINVPTPPFVTFIGELALFLGLVNYLSVFSIFAFIYVFLAVVFNVYWLSSITFGPASTVYYTFATTSSFIEFVSGSIISGWMIIRVYFVSFF